MVFPNRGKTDLFNDFFKFELPKSLLKNIMNKNIMHFISIANCNLKVYIKMSNIYHPNYTIAINNNKHSQITCYVLKHSYKL